MATVDMDSLKPNSNKYKAEQSSSETSKKRLEPVIKNGVVSTKKPMSKRLAELFFAGEADNIRSYIIYDIIIPGAKNLFLDTMEMMFFGNRNNRSGYSRSSYGNDQYYYDYSNQYQGRKKRVGNKRQSDPRKPDYRNIVLERRDDAERVIDAMRGRIREQGSVSVAEMFELINIASEYTDNNWGWDDERDIGLRRVSNGFLIDVSEARYIS